MQIGVGVDTDAQLQVARVGLGAERQMSRQRRGVVVNDQVDALDRLVAGEVEAHRHQGSIQRARRCIQLHHSAAILHRTTREDCLGQSLPARGPGGIGGRGGRVIVSPGRVGSQQHGNESCREPRASVCYSHSSSLKACVTLCPW